MRDAKSHLSAFTFLKKGKKRGLNSKVSFGDKDYHVTIERDVSEAALSHPCGMRPLPAGLLCIRNDPANGKPMGGLCML